MRVRFAASVLLILAVLSLASMAAAQDATATAEATAAACPPGPVASSAPVIKVGAALSATGTYVHEGGDTLNGYTLWAEWVNQEHGGIDVGGTCYQVKLITYDDQSKADMTASLTEKLISTDKVNFLLGAYSTGLVQAGSAVSDKDGVLMVEGGGAGEGLFTRGFKNFFGVLTTASIYTESSIEMAAALGAKTAVIAVENEPFSISAAQGAEQWLAQDGITVVDKESYPTGASDVSDIMTKFKGLKPDLFIDSGHYNDSLVFTKAAKAADFNPSGMLFTVGPSDPAFVKALGADANDVYGAAQWDPSLKYKDDYFGTAADYAARYQKRFGVQPSYQAAGGTAAGLTLELGIEAAGSLDTDAVRMALHGLKVETFWGPIAFDDTGKNPDKPMVTTQVQNGDVVVVAPEAAAEAKAIWPVPAWSAR